MLYYIEVDSNSQPKHRINYCFKCRLIELCIEKPPKFHPLIKIHEKLFQEYLSENSRVPESEIRNILRNAQINFKLETPTFLAHKHDGEAAARDMIHGFATKRYDDKSKFCLILEERVYNHSAAGYHAVGQREFREKLPIASIIYNLICKDEFDLTRYGEDIMDCVLTYIPEWPAAIDLKPMLLQLGVEYPYDSLCRLAVTNNEVLQHAVRIHALNKRGFPELWRRNIEIAQTCENICSKHKSLGLNILDILVFVNPEPLIVIDFASLENVSERDLQLLVKSLKYWLENVRDEAEFAHIQNRIWSLESGNLRIDLMD